MECCTGKKALRPVLTGWYLGLTALMAGLLCGFVDDIYTETAIDWESDKASPLNHLRHVEGLHYWIIGVIALQAITHGFLARYAEDNGYLDELQDSSSKNEVTAPAVIFQFLHFVRMWFTAAICINFLGYADFWGIFFGASLFASTSIMHASMSHTEDKSVKAGFSVTSIIIMSVFFAFFIVRWLQSTGPEVCYWDQHWTPVMAFAWLTHAIVFVFRAILNAAGKDFGALPEVVTDFIGFHLMVLSWTLIIRDVDQSCGVPP